MLAKPERSQSDQRVQLDLNSPAFLRSWFVPEKDEEVRVLNALEKLKQLTWPQVYRDPGLKWEAIANFPVRLPPGISSVHSLRITQAGRAVACRESRFMGILWMVPDHDSTYQQSRK